MLHLLLHISIAEGRGEGDARPEGNWLQLRFERGSGRKGKGKYNAGFGFLCFITPASGSSQTIFESLFPSHSPRSLLQLKLSHLHARQKEGEKILGKDISPFFKYIFWKLNTPFLPHGFHCSQ